MSLLHQILSSRQVQDNDGNFSELHSAMGAEEGEIITRAFAAAQPETSLEVGLAYGISALFACAANQSLHIMIDPVQSTYWRGIGMKNLDRAGYRHKIRLIEQPSELALP